MFAASRTASRNEGVPPEPKLGPVTATSMLK